MSTGAAAVQGTATFDAPQVDPNAWSGAPIGTGSFSVATSPTSTGGPSSIAAIESQAGQRWHYVVIGDFTSSTGVALAIVSDQPFAVGTTTIDALHHNVVVFNPSSGTVIAEAGSGTFTLSAAGSALGQHVTGSLSASFSPVASQCTVDADCALSEVCQGGTCVTAPPPPPPACRVDADCGLGQVCASGVCVSGPPPQCTSNAQCARGQVCQAGLCVTPTPTTCAQLQGSGSYSATFGPVAACSAAGSSASVSHGMAVLDDSNGGLELYVVDAATQTEGVVVQLTACPAAAGTVQLGSGEAELYSTVSNASAGLDLFVRRSATGGSVTFSQVGASLAGTLSLTFAGGGSLSGSFVVQ